VQGLPPAWKNSAECSSASVAAEAATSSLPVQLASFFLKLLPPLLALAADSALREEAAVLGAW